MERKQTKSDKTNELPHGPKGKHQRITQKESSVKSRGKNGQRWGSLGGEEEGSKAKAVESVQGGQTDKQ